jgi:flagellar biosynthesis protein FlhF
MGALIQLRESATLLNFPRAAQSARSLVAAALKYHRLPDLLAEALLRDIGAGDNPELLLAAALEKRMRPQPIDFQKARGILLLGPMGAGKSAVAAKIMHIAALVGRKSECASAADGMALFRTASFESDALMVMEAPGFNPINRRALSAFSALGEADGVECIGVVSAAGDAEDVADIVGALRLKRIIVTGLDRTSRLGATVAAIAGCAGLAHVTYGPRPDDTLDTLAPELLAKMLLD